ncbi:hypothetical protein Q9Q95_05810 [Sphingomonas sp. DG1-23]|uniref:hypothetical protein n=1 Tax=Sphingomonas sp. DG1-23 TaxID=3068316 RepID=UPI00273D1808|nr:hypothetical protein [Sphingomonas sp. DG1-23]MDP5278432.1 hypothetical protein [Sphingomonas sp. DG1-23]
MDRHGPALGASAAASQRRNAPRARPAEPGSRLGGSYASEINESGEAAMGKGILLWLLGIPLPIIILLLLFWH